MKNRLRFLCSIIIIIMLFSASFVSAQTTLYRANSGTRQTLRAVFFPDDSNGFIVGDSGAISITSDGGNSWFTEPSGVHTNFYTEYFNDSANGAFAGDDGTIYTVLQDNPPIKVTLPESNPIYAMTFPDFYTYDTAIVAGAQGLFYRSLDSGKTWKKITLPAEYQNIDFYGTDFLDEDSYWLVGQNGVVIYTGDDGKTWQQYAVPTTKNLYSIYFPDDGSATGWIVGDSTLLITIDGGDDWASIGTTDSLRSVEGWDSTDAYAVGLNGQILFTTNRSNWNILPAGTSANLYGFDYTDDWLYFTGDSGIILTTLPQAAPPQPNFVVEGDFSVPGSELSFGNTPDGTNSADDATIINISSVPVTIANIACDSSEFTINAGNPTPFTIDSGGKRTIQLTFTPRISATVQTYHSTLRVFSTQDSERDAPLVGVGEPSANSVASPTNTGGIDILLTSGSQNTFIEYPNNTIGPIRLEVFNLLGVSVYSVEGVLTSGANALPSSLPPGIYVYRMSGASGSQVGKFSLE